MTDKPTLRPLSASDLAVALELLPQLADFDVPVARNPKHLWESDAELLKRVANQDAEHSYAEVAVGASGEILGVILVTLKAELLSQSPSAHLEAIVVNPSARGQGVGRQLLDHAEQTAQARGAKSMSLHVFSNNHRARSLYNSQGYDSELIRAIKWLESTA